MNQDPKDLLTERVMICDKCGKPTIQSEIDENDGNCPNCNEKFILASQG